VDAFTAAYGALEEEEEEEDEDGRMDKVEARRWVEVELVSEERC
jgi:hypothetical protein